MQGEIQCEALANDGHEHVDADGDPDLSLDGVLRGAEEGFDSQMLLDPLEEQFHLPAAAIELGDRECRQLEVVGEEHERLALLGLEPNAPQRLGVADLGVEHRERDRLIADQARGSVHCAGVAARGLEIGFGTRDKEHSCLVQPVQALEIEIAPVHDVEGARLGQQLVQDVHVVEFSVGDVDEARDVAAQVDQRVQLDGRLGGAKPRPRKQRQAQVDRRGIERVDRVFQIDAEGLVHVESARDANRVLRNLRVDAPIARFVCIGKRALGHRSANAQVVELGRVRTQTGFDVAQALAVGQLRKRHAAELARATEFAHPTIAAVALDDAPEGLPRQMLHQLREHQLAYVHGRRSSGKNRQIRPIRRSSR